MTTLVPLSDVERAHEARVGALIERELEANGGWLPFARYMQLALYAPGLGYYAAGAHKLGRGGDFVTAPELSPVFGRALARQCADVLGVLGHGGILELGAGSGALAAELLGALARLGCLPERYRILEPSPDLRERQRERLLSLPAALGRRIEWLEHVPAEPFAGLVLANEVLDALPVERFSRTAAGIVALGVGRGQERFAWVARSADAALARAVGALEAERGAPFAAGYESELCPSLGAWVAAVTAPLERGVALFIDYGLARASYYAPGRSTGTFACYHRQRRHEDPFVNLGLQDLTAWVDFTRVAEAGVAVGLEVAGYSTQANFLLALGFEEELAALRAETDPTRAPLLGRTAARLVLPTEMGESFKCIALSRGYAPPLRGFALKDFTASL